MRAAIVVFLLSISSAGRADPNPTDRAKAIIETQRALIDKGHAGVKTFLGQLDPAAVIVSSMAVTTPKAILAAVSAADGDNLYHRIALAPMFQLSDMLKEPPWKQTIKTSVANVVAGGRADVLWFTFELTVATDATIEGKPRKTSDTFRITEVATAAGGWKVALFHLDKPQKDAWDDLPSAGGGPPSGEKFPDDAGDKTTPLADLAESPKLLGKALANEPSTIVLGSSAADRGVGGAAAAKVVAGWAGLKLAANQAFERKTKAWGFAVVRLDLNGKNDTQRMRMFATVIAVPKADGTWQVVTLRYSRIRWF
jgi:hypothetical protein